MQHTRGTLADLCCSSCSCACYTMTGCPPALLLPARYLDFMEGHLKETCNYTLQPDLKNELFTAILHLEVRQV